MTAPIRDWQVVAGKYIACLLFYCRALAADAGVHAGADELRRGVTSAVRHRPWPVFTSYLGVFLAGAMFLAIGLFVSSLVKSQLVAAMISLVISLIFMAAAFARPTFDGGSLVERLIYFISVPEHFRRDFCRGILDTRHIVLYVTVTLFSPVSDGAVAGSATTVSGEPGA